MLLNNQRFRKIPHGCISCLFGSLIYSKLTWTATKGSCSMFVSHYLTDCTHGEVQGLFSLSLESQDDRSCKVAEERYWVWQSNHTTTMTILSKRFPPVIANCSSLPEIKYQTWSVVQRDNHESLYLYPLLNCPCFTEQKSPLCNALHAYCRSAFKTLFSSPLQQLLFLILLISQNYLVRLACVMLEKQFCKDILTCYFSTYSELLIIKYRDDFIQSKGNFSLLS